MNDVEIAALIDHTRFGDPFEVEGVKYAAVWIPRELDRLLGACSQCPMPGVGSCRCRYTPAAMGTGTTDARACPCVRAMEQAGKEFNEGEGACRVVPFASIPGMTINGWLV